MDKLVEALKDFGLSDYESKVLLTLLAKGELSAAEIATYSGVPRTSVYEVVKSLTSKGVVEEAGGKPMKFKSIRSEDLMTLFSRRLKENVDYLKKELPAIEEEEKKEEIVKLYTGDVAYNVLRECVEKCQKEIIVASASLDQQMVEVIKDAHCKVVVIAPNVADFQDKNISEEHQMDVEFTQVGVRHGMFLLDERKVAIYLKQENNLRLMVGTGSFAEFYKMFLHSFIKQKVKE
ncbi:MAG: helix-turn-helix domain-containing protein [Archaeoglobaceae archaeon]